MSTDFCVFSAVFSSHPSFPPRKKLISVLPERPLTNQNGYYIIPTVPVLMHETKQLHRKSTPKKQIKCKYRGVAKLTARLLWGTFATAACGGNREQKGVAAVETNRAPTDAKIFSGTARGRTKQMEHAYKKQQIKN